MKHILNKLNASFILAVCFLIPSIGAAEVQEMKPASNYCAKATGLSKGLSEQIARKLEVSVASVRLLRSEPLNNGYCNITVDSSRGPQSCWVSTVYSDGKDYWMGGFCF